MRHLIATVFVIGCSSSAAVRSNVEHPMPDRAGFDAFLAADCSATRDKMRHIDGDFVDAMQPTDVQLLVDKLVTCKDSFVFSEQVSQLANETNDLDVAVDRLLAAVARQLPVRDTFIAMLATDADFSYWVTMSWALKSTTSADCAALEKHTREGQARGRSVLVTVFTNKQCKREAIATARELLNARELDPRELACKTLAFYGDRSMMARILEIAENDEADERDWSGTRERRYKVTNPRVSHVCRHAFDALSAR